MRVGMCELSNEGAAGHLLRLPGVRSCQLGCQGKRQSLHRGQRPLHTCQRRLQTCLRRLQTCAWRSRPCHTHLHRPQPRLRSRRWMISSWLALPRLAASHIWRHGNVSSGCTPRAIAHLCSRRCSREVPTTGWLCSDASWPRARTCRSLCVGPMQTGTSLSSALA